MLFHPRFADPPTPLVTPAPQAPSFVAPNRGDITPAHVPGFGVLFAHWGVGEWVEYSALVALTLVLTAIAVTTLIRMLHAWRSTSNFSNTGVSIDPRPRHSFSLLVPVRHEGVVMSTTLDRLAQQDHPDFQIIAIVGDDDPSTELAARIAADRHPDIISVVIDESVSKTRPTALNRGLDISHGDVIGVFDAGDEAHPRLVSLVDSRFSETGADVVQGGMQIMNFQASWWSLRSVLENYFRSRSSLQLQAKSRSIPLGDSTVFIKRNWLEWSGGWDEKCVAESYELGVRLSSGGAKIVVAYSPEVVTREENPRGIASLFAERSRLGLGSLQILGKGEWRRLPLVRQRLLARYRLLEPFLQSATAVLIPASILVALFLAVPTVIALITLIPLAVVILTLVVEAAGLSEFGALYGQKVRIRDYAGLVLGTFPYLLILAAASLNAVVTALERDYSLEQRPRPNVVHDDSDDRDAIVAEPKRARGDTMSTVVSRSAPVGARELDPRLTRNNDPNRRRNRAGEWIHAHSATLGWLTPIVVVAGLVNAINLAGSPTQIGDEATPP